MIRPGRVSAILSEPVLGRYLQGSVLRQFDREGLSFHGNFS